VRTTSLTPQTFYLKSVTYGYKDAGCKHITIEVCGWETLTVPDASIFQAKYTRLSSNTALANYQFIDLMPWFSCDSDPSACGVGTATYVVTNINNAVHTHWYSTIDSGTNFKLYTGANHDYW
jgi:hypothetical protein